ncbi:hypothetical protein GCM10010398_35220 [Streptomyces fimbriatus]
MTILSGASPRHSDRHQSAVPEVQPAATGGDSPASDGVADSDADRIAGAPLLRGQQKATMGPLRLLESAEAEREFVFATTHHQGRTFFESVLHDALE